MRSDRGLHTMSVPSPPPPPPPTHAEALVSLPAFPPGGAGDRLVRAREYVRQTHAIVEAFHRSGASGLSTCRLLSEATDRLVRGLFEELAAETQAPPGLALVALGSYGRCELSPHSDLDLLLLRPPGSPEEGSAALARALPTLLWDLKRTVGWSTRSPEECARAAEDDHTVRTALLDCRFLAGEPSTAAGLTGHVLPELLGRGPEAFIQDKVQELRTRRERYGDSVFLLEPHLKQGDGGLRDLETALWIAQVRFRARDLQGLLQKSILPGSEVTRLEAARDFLLRIRHQLHFLRGRKEDRLTFELQVEVARFLGYPEQGPVLPVEAFMRDYYLAAHALRLAADGLISRCEELGPARRGPSRDERRLGPFKVFSGRLSVSDASLFQREPSTLLDFFRTAEEHGLPLYSWARQQVVQALPALEAARASPAVTTAFLALFARPGTRGELLFELHDTGVLGAVLPEFGRITAHHQNDLYHVYTVDVHTLFALRRLYTLRAGDLLEEEPELSRAMRDLEDPLPLYLGMLLHDAGKGLGGNHSEKGRGLMVSVGGRLGLSPRQREVAEFLVLEHLLMSHTAQRRDLSDPALIADFARRVGDVEKLTCLYLLTWADIRSVAPGMWTGWKAQLLRELYDKARAWLLGTTEGQPGPGREQFHARWARVFGEARAHALAQVLPERYFLGTSPARATLHARLLDRARRRTLAAALRHLPEAGHSELALAARDRPGLLALLAGVLSAHRIDILSARIVSTTDGLALDVFDVRPPHGLLLERSRWRAARADLVRVLSGAVSSEEVLRRRRSGSLLQRPLPPVAPKVTVDNRASRGFTVVDVVARDRVGLLHAIASALTASGAQIALAKVATEAHRAVDSFYVTREGARVERPEEVKALVSSLTAALQALEREG
jgi:[protein-PII] uridylyltransferase